MRRAAALLVLLAACSGAPFEGLAPSRDTGGPKVVFDLTRQPLPAIPFPNDVVTRVDPSSPTGLRLNGALIAPSQLDRTLRGLLDTLDGFGTFAPLTVAFDRDLDVVDLFARQNDADPANDAVYLVDLVSGVTMPLDFNGGHFPYTLNDPGKYFLNDANAGAFNLLFPVSGPFANFFHPELPHDSVRQQADDLLTFYERATRTLVIRPVLPLAQERRYAVVLTNRLRGLDGKAIVSPHSGINHVSQTAELQPLLQHLPPGTPLDAIAYAWAFTTQSTTRDLETIRAGLYGSGPLQLLGLQYAVQNGISTTNYSTLMQILQERGAFTAGTPSTNAGDYILPVNECDAAGNGCLAGFLTDPRVQSILIGTNPAETAALLDTFRYLDYVVSGTFTSPGFLDTDPSAAQDQTLRFDPQTGNARVVPQTITFTLAVPKERPEAGHLAPFPVVIGGHGFQTSRLEPILSFAGTFAKFGLATVSIDAFGHGLAVDPLTELLIRGVAHDHGLDGFANALLSGRARDLDNDGIKDPGGDFWTADIFHTRDVLRQSVIDWMQLVHVLRTFDGTGTMALGSTVTRAGDFNNDGIPDVAGPTSWPRQFSARNATISFDRGALNPGSDLFVFGVSLGGILSGMLPAVEPRIVAAAPTSAAGGLSDVAARSSLDSVVNAVFLQAIGPFLATCPFSPSSGSVDAQTLLHTGACNGSASDAQPMLVLVVADLTRERDFPIAPLSLSAGQRVMVQNLAQTAADCSGGASVQGCSIGAADAQGALRLPIGADWPSLAATRTTGVPGSVDQVQVQVLSPGDPLRISVFPVAGGAPAVIDKLQVSSRFFGVNYNAQDPLTSPARGFGRARNTPELRRLIALSQLILDPGDPVNYAPHYSGDLAARAGNPANVLVIGTSGDPSVPVSTAFSLARAAGLVEAQRVDPAYGATVDQVLIRSGAVEGVPATHRFDDPDGGVFSALPGEVRCDRAGCGGDVLIDLTGYSCDAGVCSDALAAPRLDPPLRGQLVRQTQPPTSCAPQKRAGAGCYSTGASACDPSAAGFSALLLPYLNRSGQHGFKNPQPTKPFDMDQFMANVVGRYFECRGRELRFDACQQDLASCPWIPSKP